MLHLAEQVDGAAYVRPGVLDADVGEVEVAANVGRPVTREIPALQPTHITHSLVEKFPKNTTPRNST